MPGYRRALLCASPRAGWILGAILYTLSILESPRDDMWVNTHLVILALGSVAAYVLPFRVCWSISKGLWTHVYNPHFKR